MSRYSVTVWCPVCKADAGMATVTVDPGCYRTPNGDGWPATTEVELDVPTRCADCSAEFTEAHWEAMEQQAADAEAPEPEWGGPDGPEDYDE